MAARRTRTSDETGPPPTPAACETCAAVLAIATSTIDKQQKVDRIVALLGAK